VGSLHPPERAPSPLAPLARARVFTGASVLLQVSEPLDGTVDKCRQRYQARN
jgi:hypothetical protein